MKSQQQQQQRLLMVLATELCDGMNMSRVTQQSVPRILTQDQCDDRMSICGDLINSADKDATFLCRIITVDKTWRFLYDPQLKRQLATWEITIMVKKEETAT
jgi:hypothetical protein